MSDSFENFTQGLQSPPSRALNVVPNDANDLASFTRCINVAASGAVRVTTIGDDVVTLSVAAGIPFPIRAKRIWATGTTATGIVGLY